MKSLKLPVIVLLLIAGKVNAQTENNKPEISHITATLMDYIEGTANGEPDRLRKAFHPDFNLYAVTKEDSLLIRSGEQYISNVKKVKKQTELEGSFR